MLRATQLRKAFGPLQAVDGLDFEVGRGEVFGLLGPNGAGKSTTMAMLMGLLTPDSGTVTIDEVGAPASERARSRLGYAPQNLAVYDDLTGLENLRFFARLYRLADVDAAAARSLDLVGLTGRGNDRASGYSGGMKRRLNLAIALLHDPPVLLLDEPTAGVDPQSRNNILEIVRNLASLGRTIVYTTHYMEEAAKLCDRVAIVDKGRKLAEGTVQELISTYGARSVVTIIRAGEEQRLETADPLREIATAMAMGPLESVRIDRPDLESVFLALTGRSLRD